MVDWWGLGIILFRMLTGVLPYPTNKNSEVRVFIQRCRIDIPKNKIPNEATRDFLYRMLEPDPELRLGANGVEEIMDHEFFADIDWEALSERKLKPPYNPKVRSEKDVKHIDPKYLDSEIMSYTMDDNDLKAAHMHLDMYDGFSYAREDALNKSGRMTTIQ